MNEPDFTFFHAFYDDAARSSRFVDEAGRPRELVTDYSGRVVWTKEAIGANPGEYASAHASYDHASNIVAVSDPLNQMTRVEYNHLNQAVQTLYPDGTREERAYNRDGTLAGRTTFADASNTSKFESTRYLYDDFLRLCGVEATRYSGGTPVDGASVVYSYTENGWPARVETSSAGLTSCTTPANPTSRLDYTYDAQDRVTVEKLTVDPQNLIGKRAEKRVSR